jgi:hypothetical protein
VPVVKQVGHLSPVLENCSEDTIRVRCQKLMSTTTKPIRRASQSRTRYPGFASPTRLLRTFQCGNPGSRAPLNDEPCTLAYRHEGKLQQLLKSQLPQRCRRVGHSALYRASQCQSLPEGGPQFELSWPRFSTSAFVALPPAIRWHSSALVLLDHGDPNKTLAKAPRQGDIG